MKENFVVMLKYKNSSTWNQVSSFSQLAEARNEVESFIRQDAVDRSRGYSLSPVGLLGNASVEYPSEHPLESVRIVKQTVQTSVLEEYSVSGSKKEAAIGQGMAWADPQSVKLTSQSS